MLPGVTVTSSLWHSMVMTNSLLPIILPKEGAAAGFLRGSGSKPCRGLVFGMVGQGSVRVLVDPPSGLPDRPADSAGPSGRVSWVPPCEVPGCSKVHSPGGTLRGL